MTKIILGSLLAGFVIAALLAWRVKSVKARIIIGIVVAIVLVVGMLLALVLGGDH